MPPRFAQTLATFSSAPGTTSSEVRRAIVAYAGDPSSAAGALPDALRDYVAKVSLDPSRVADEDVQALRAAGFDDDAIFEVTVGAALGAGAARIERGLAALRASR